MATTITTKRNDTKITFTHTPTIDGVTVPPANFAGCTVKFILKIKDAPTGIIQTAVINLDGTFSYDPIPGDVDTVGTYQQEWEVTYPSSKKLTFPNDTWNIVKIIPDLDT
jgi:hypothetical protein